MDETLTAGGESTVTASAASTLTADEFDENLVIPPDEQISLFNYKLIFNIN